MLTLRRKKNAPVAVKRWMMTMEVGWTTYKKIVDKEPTEKDIIEFVTEQYGGKIIKSKAHVSVTVIWEVTKKNNKIECK